MRSRTLLRMTSPVGPPFDIPYHDLGPSSKNPGLVLIGGLHGNELNGIFVLARLAGLLKDIERGKVKGVRLKKRVVIVPAVNVLGMALGRRTWPIDKTDINRMFPGYDAGETTQRIAAAVFKLSRSAAIRIDIHSSNDEFAELPQVRLYDSTEKERATALLLGLPAMIECPINKTSASTLLYAWKQEGGQSFVVQAGAAGDIQMEPCETLYQSLLRFLVRTKILGDPNASVVSLEENDESWYFNLRHTVSLVSEKAGLFVSSAPLGQWVEKGAPLGNVYDGFDGAIRFRVRAPVSGFLTGLRRQALLYQGDLLARIQATRPVASGADTYLIGQGQ